jgi:hypothetical protein
MEMSAEEIKAFWRGFCERRALDKDVVARGEAKIDKDPERWADEPMTHLLDLISN